MGQKDSNNATQEPADAMSKLLYTLLDSDIHSNILLVANNELATRDHLLEATALCILIPEQFSTWRRDITKAILGHQQADDIMATLLCDNGYFSIWKTVASSACASERTLSKLTRKVDWSAYSDSRQEELAQAIMNNPNFTDDVLALLACKTEVPCVCKAAQERLGSLSISSEK